MVESTLIDVEEKACSFDVRGIENSIEECILFFIEAIEETDNLKIVGTSFNDKKKKIFIIEDISNSGEHIEVLISEIIEQVKSIKIAKEFVKIIHGERSPIVLNGITRIVGYFSRVNNWNRSKIGELRDRRKGEYSVNRSN